MEVLCVVALRLNFFASQALPMQMLLGLRV